MTCCSSPSCSSVGGRGKVSSRPWLCCFLKSLGLLPHSSPVHSRCMQIVHFNGHCKCSALRQIKIEHNGHCIKHDILYAYESFCSLWSTCSWLYNADWILLKLLKLQLLFATEHQCVHNSGNQANSQTDRKSKILLIIFGMEALGTFQCANFKMTATSIYYLLHFQRASITLVHFHNQNSHFSEGIRHIILLSPKFYMTRIVVWTVASYSQS